MKKILSKILFIYSALIAIVVTLSSGTFVFFFLPVLTYFLFKVTRLVSGGLIEKLLIYWGFIISGVLTITGASNASSPKEFAVVAVFSPMMVYFLMQILPKRNKAVHLPIEAHIEIQPVKGKKPEKLDPEVLKLKKQGVDVDRRMFLKAIASAGLSLFLFSIFTKKAEAAFFGSVPGPGIVSLKDTAGNKIDPAIKHPTDGYNITELDDATPSYYGFVNKDGAWFIMKEDAAHGPSVPYYSYVKGSSDFTNATTGWPNRANLTYGYFDAVFS